MRNDVSFHNGVRLTAEIIAQSLDHAFMVSGVRRPEGIEVLNDLALILRFSEPAPNLLAFLAQPVFVIVDPPNLDAHDPTSAAWPSGTGPYSIVHALPDVQVALERNELHWDASAYENDYLVFELFADTGAMEHALREGAVDISFVESPPSFEADPSYQLFDTQQVDTFAIGFNTNHPALDDVRVRQALAFAIDRALLVKALSIDNPGLALAPWPAEEGFSGLGAYDPERALGLLAEAGFPGGGFRIELLTSGDSVAEQDALGFVRSMWSEIGVTLDLVDVGDARDLQSLLDQDAADRAASYQAWLYGFGLQPSHPPLQAFGCRQPVAWEQFCTDALDGLADVALNLEPREFQRQLQELDVELSEEVFRIPIWTVPQQYVAARTVLSAYSADDTGQDAREVVARSQGTTSRFFDGSVPPPSRHAKLDRDDVVGDADIDDGASSATVRDVSTRLSSALRGAGHDELMYLPLLHSGFVITTSPEWIDGGGISLREGRFAMEPHSLCRSRSSKWWWRLWECIVESAVPTTGTARVYVLRVSPEPWSRQPSEAVKFISRQDLLDWTTEGTFDRLPVDFPNPPFDVSYEVDVLVYEVEVVGNKWTLNESSPHDGPVHLNGTCRFEPAEEGEIEHCFLPLLVGAQ